MFQFSRGRQAVGTFVKTASPHVVEVLGLTGLDFLVVDSEHAPFGRGAIDLMLLASRAAGIPVLVRVPDHASASIAAALDMGAAGVVVPHVDTPEEAAALIAHARFTGGARGYSPSPRYGNYGTKSREQVIEAGDASLVVCQIESRTGLDKVEEIARVPGVSALFIGRGDLAQSLGVTSARDPAVMDAVLRICSACAAAGVPVVVALDGEQELAAFHALGVDGYVVGTDQSLLRRAACGVRAALDRHLANNQESAS